jgi:hypothetical protein
MSFAPFSNGSYAITIIFFIGIGLGIGLLTFSRY